MVEWYVSKEVWSILASLTSLPAFSPLNACINESLTGQEKIAAEQLFRWNNEEGYYGHFIARVTSAAWSWGIVQGGEGSQLGQFKLLLVRTLNLKGNQRNMAWNVSKSETSLAHFGSSVIMCEGPPSQAQELEPTLHAWHRTHHLRQSVILLCMKLLPHDEVYNMLRACNVPRAIIVNSL